MDKYFSRRLEGNLSAALKQFPVCLITGARQTGKSTLLTHALKGYQYITLDDPQMRTIAEKDPELFLNQYAAPLIIDEIQYAPNLLSYIKIRVDKNRRSYGQYILTGSQTFQVMEGVSESLAGRIAIFHLYPFSWEEIDVIPGRENSSLNLNKMLQQMITGFYPEAFINPAVDPSTWYSSYLMTYIQRDVRNIKSITDLGRFQTFISLLAARAGQLLKLSEVAKECGITQPTAKSWLSILESTYIVYLLKPFHNNRTKRLVKTPKIYFIDTGLLCYLLGLTHQDNLLKTFDRGSIFENMVIMEGIKRLSHDHDFVDCTFYRTASGVEVDLIVKRKGHLEGYEIKFAQTVSKEMAKGLLLFDKDHPLAVSNVLSLRENSIPLDKLTTAVHWSKVLKEV
ncbi:MAG: ATP-binding protein [Simkaniaceae bacterium]|nr:MAG: ATP-binding protein [Simkaniaceae bacterium]